MPTRKKSMEEVMSGIPHFIVTSPALVVGQNNAFTEAQEMVIIEPSNIMAESIQALPYLVGLTIMPFVSPAYADDMRAGVVNYANVDLFVFNGVADNSFTEDGHQFVAMCIASSHIIASVDTATTFGTFIESVVQDKSYHEAIPIINKLSFLVQIRTEQNVGTSDLAAGLFKFMVFPEIVWEPATADEVKDFAVKGVFAQQAIRREG